MINRETYNHTTLPISEYQKVFFLEWALRPSEITYNIAYIQKVNGTLDLRRIKEACTFFIRNHEIVHAQFSGDGTHCYYGAFEIEDIYCEGVFDVSRSVEEQLKNFLYKPFDLTEGPLLRIYVLKNESTSLQEYYFFFVAHHIICDATWVSLFFTEIASLYNAGIVEMQRRDVSVNTFSLAVERGNLIYDEFYKDQAKLFWKDLLEDTPLRTELPYRSGIIESDLDSFLADKTGEFIYFEIDSSKTEELKTHAADKGVSLFVLLSGLYGLCISKFSGQKKFFLTYPVNTRPVGFSDTAGCFVNNIPMKIDLDSFSDLGQLILELTLQRRKAKLHQGYALRSILKDQRRENERDINDLFNVGFSQSYLNALAFDLNDMQVTPIDLAWSINSVYEFGLLYDDRSPALRFKLEYRKCLFDADAVAKFVDEFKIAIDTLIMGGSLLSSELSLLPESSYVQQVRDWNRTDQDYDSDRTIHLVFENRAKLLPENTAVVYKGLSLSYRELEERSNQLARHIRKHYALINGVSLERGSLVGLLLDRSLELVIGILGVLKSGGAYVPLDPSYPVERISYILT
ncbi:AMP-binding enzyme, partial [Mucilaginibacter oryzae]